MKPKCPNCGHNIRQALMRTVDIDGGYPHFVHLTCAVCQTAISIRVRYGPVAATVVTHVPPDETEAAQ